MSSATSPSAAEIRDAIAAILAEMLECERGSITPEAHLVKDLGADSMSVLELMAAVEKRFGVVIKPEHFPELVTLEGCSGLVERLLKA